MIVLLAVAGLAACSKAPAEKVAVAGTPKRVALPDHVAIVVPTGWTGDLAGLADGSSKAVEVLAVDPAGHVTPVTAVDLSGGGAANEQLAKANRSIGMARLTKAKVPAGSGYGDVFAGARAALEGQTAPVRVVTLATGCLEVSGQRLQGADLATAKAVQAAADLFERSGVLGFPAADGDVLVLAGAGACASNGVDSSARLRLADRLCAATRMACVAREAEVSR
jgi:hypothetical protein